MSSATLLPHRLAATMRLSPSFHPRAALGPSIGVGGPSRVIRTITARALLSTSNSNPIPACSISHPRLVLTRHLSTASPRPISPAPPPSHTGSSPEPQPEPEPDASADAEPELDPKNTSAYARLKVMSKKYGWWALGMYFALSSVDFTLSFLAVHALGAERISPLLDAAKGFYRERRYGAEEAERLKAVDQAAKEEALREREESEMEADANANANAKGRGNGGGGWGTTFGPTFWTEVALAYAIHKTALLPLRAGLTVAWTPKLVGWLTRRGWVGKGGLTRAATHAQGKVKDASERVKERVKRAPPA